MLRKTIFIPSWVRYWDYKLRSSEWPGYKIFFSLVRKFLHAFDIADREQFSAIRGRPCVFLANHQTYVESLIFTTIASALTDRMVVAIAKLPHRTGWIGRLVDLCFSYPGVNYPDLIRYVDRHDPDELPALLFSLKQMLNEENRSLLVHVDGSRRSSALHDRVFLLSSCWVDFAVDNDYPIVPVRFMGGLPVEDQGSRYDFPVGCGTQSFRMGRPILPEELRAVSCNQRRAVVRSAINNLALPEEKRPLSADPLFESAAQQWSEYAGVPASIATIFAAVDYFQPGWNEPVNLKDYETADPIEALVMAGRMGIQHRGDVALIVSDSEKGRWLARIADFFYGPCGPRVCRGCHGADSAQARVTVVEAPSADFMSGSDETPAADFGSTSTAIS